MKNLKEVTKRIKKALEKKEKIILFGDADLDGITSTVMLKEAIEHIGGSPIVYLSNREEWGYGLSREAVEIIKNQEKKGVLITLDCGISNFEGAELAIEMGFSLIIIDHHKAFQKLPSAELILDPTQKGDEYPFKKMANVGVVYKLVEDILGEDFSEKKNKFLELAVLGTVADMVPRKEDNKKILEEGLPLFNNPSIPALRVLEKEGEVLLGKAISLLNITTPQGKTNKGYIFLNKKTEKEAKEMLKDLEQERKERKKVLLKEEERVIQKAKKEGAIIFEEGNFPPHLAGSLASRVVRKINKPIFLYSIEGDLAKGSVRSVSEYDVVEAMEFCGNLFEAFGGHPEAAGFTAKKENLKKIKGCLEKHFINFSQK